MFYSLSDGYHLLPSIYFPDLAAFGQDYLRVWFLKKRVSVLRILNNPVLVSQHTIPDRPIFNVLKELTITLQHL